MCTRGAFLQNAMRRRAGGRGGGTRACWLRFVKPPLLDTPHINSQARPHLPGSRNEKTLCIKQTCMQSMPLYTEQVRLGGGVW